MMDMDRTEFREQSLDARRIHPEGQPMNTSTYTNWRCRCEGCRDAWAEYTRDRKAEREQEQRDVGVNPRLGEHPPGRAFNENTYTNYGCRCEACTADHTKQSARRRRQRERARQMA